jgi:predicted nucleic acid-binding protein
MHRYTRIVTMPSIPPQSSHLDEGEAQALSLAHALNCSVLMDKRRGRQEAIRRGMKSVGVLGVLLQAKRIGKIGSLAPIITRMLDDGYRIAPVMIEATLKLAGETD